jgi:hypothetical protein
LILYRPTSVVADVDSRRDSSRGDRAYDAVTEQEEIPLEVPEEHPADTGGTE